jgi:hypothetical protein
MTFSDKIFNLLNNEHGFLPVNQTFKILIREGNDAISIYFEKLHNGNKPLFGFCLDSNISINLQEELSEILRECTLGKNCGKVFSVLHREYWWEICEVLTKNEDWIISTIETLEQKARKVIEIAMANGGIYDYRIE